MMSNVLCFGVICAIQAIVCWLHATRIFTPRFSAVPTWLLYVGGHLLLCAAYAANCGALAALALFGLVNLLLLLLFHCSPVQAICHSTLLSLVLACCEGVTMLLLVGLTDHFGADSSDLIAITTHAVLYLPLFFWFVTVLGRVFDPQPDGSDPAPMLLLSLLPLVTEIVCFAFVYVICTVQPSPVTERMMVICMLALLVVDLLALVIYSNIQKLFRESTLQQLAAQKNRDDVRLYEALLQQHKTQRILIHDIRRHTQMVEAMLMDGRQDQAIEYLRGINAHPAIQNDKVFCQNGTLNIILAQHHSRCRASGVQLHTDIRESCIDGMDAVSITALFGNLLTNACEAAERSGQKYIEFAITPQQTGGVLITVENSCDRPPRVDEKGLFVTQKRDKAAHGVGISSIVQVVHKYGGTLRMYYNAAEKAVHTVIGIPPIGR